MLCPHFTCTLRSPSWCEPLGSKRNRLTFDVVTAVDTRVMNRGAIPNGIPPAITTDTFWNVIRCRKVRYARKFRKIILDSCSGFYQALTAWLQRRRRGEFFFINFRTCTPKDAVLHSRRQKFPHREP